MALATALALVAAGSADAAPVAASFGHYNPPPAFAGNVTTSLYLPMRDGVRLAVSVTRPAVGGQPAPAVSRCSGSTPWASPAPGPRAAGDDPARKGYRGMPDLVRMAMWSSRWRGARRGPRSAAGAATTTAPGL